MRFTLRLWLSCLLLAPALLAQQPINARTQIKWPPITGMGTPTATGAVCSPSHYGQPYQNDAVTPHTTYSCGPDGWVEGGGGGTGTVSDGAGTTTAGLPAISTGTAHVLTYGSVNSGGNIFGSYTFYVSAGTVYAHNNVTGVDDYSNADACVVINDVTTALATSGGKLFFKNGIYPCNSLTQETTSGWTDYYYGIGLPAGTSSQWVQWLFEGESRAAWNWGVDQNMGVAVQNNGVIFNITPTAIATAPSGKMVMGIFQRPTSINYYSNENKFKNISVRLPNQTRGNQAAIAMWMASALEYDNVEAGLAMIPHDLATGGVAPVAGTLGSFGLTGTYGSSGLPQVFRNTVAWGYNIGYDWNEHTISDGTADAYMCNHPWELGRGGPNAPSGGNVYHGNYIARFQDQENGGGPILGPAMQVGSRIDMPLYDIELGNGSQWFAGRTSGDFVETNPGTSVGVIDFTAVQAAVGSVTIGLFSSGGTGFCVNGVGSCGSLNLGSQVAKVVSNQQTDSFTRPNSASLGANWTNESGAFTTETYGISGNTAVASGTGPAAAFFSAASFNNDQCASVVLSSPSGGYGGPVVRAAAGDNYYMLVVTPPGGGGAPFTLQKVVSGTRSILASFSTAFTSPGTMELCAQGTTLYSYYNSSLLGTFTDTSFSSGHPGIAGINFTANAHLTNWTGNDALLVTDAAGLGAPTGCGSTVAIGSTYRRVDGGIGTTFYVCQGGSVSWVPVA